jgi:hypothetical protein
MVILAPSSICDQPVGHRDAAQAAAGDDDVQSRQEEGDRQDLLDDRRQSSTCRHEASAPRAPVAAARVVARVRPDKVLAALSTSCKTARCASCADA